MIDLGIKHLKTIHQPLGLPPIHLIVFVCNCDALVVGDTFDVLTRIWCRKYHFMDKSLPYAHGEERREAVR